MEKLKMVQVEFNEIVATNEDFWRNFHKSLSAP
jgi:hypothetical protein